MKFINKHWGLSHFKLFIICFLLPIQVFCQCNLGANIFEDGDFGTGSENIALENSIAPGYKYNRVPPLADGEYNLTNNTGLWANLYSTWLKISDNSSDPNGYMMVVNASPNAGLFYENTVKNLCENTEYEFSADVINMIRSGVGGHIGPDISFLINGEVKFSTGEIPQDEQWHNFGFTIKTTTGQTELVLALRNNVSNTSNTNGNDLALDNILFRVCGPQLEITSSGSDTICGLENATASLEANVIGNQFTTPTFQWQKSLDGQNWDNIDGETNRDITIDDFSIESNYFRVLLANSIANLSNEQCHISSATKMIYVSPTNSSTSNTICSGMTIDFGGNTLSTSGIYTEIFINIIGCDSIVTLNLKVLPDPNIMANVLVQQRSCTEQPLSAITVSNIENGYPPYSYKLRNTTLTEDVGTFSNLIVGNYELLITDKLGCTYREQVTVDTFNVFSVELGVDTIDVVLGNSTTITASSNSNVNSYEWNPTYSCTDNCEIFFDTLTENSLISLTATSDLGCVATDSVLVQVEKLRLVAFPTAFTPNGDKKNDFFTVIVSQPNVIEVKKLIIYDRWGKAVFSKTNFEDINLPSGWDGAQGGVDLPSGIYPYFAEILFLDGVVINYKGTILLVK